MRTIDRQSNFKRDFKRERLSGKHKDFDGLMSDVLRFLLADVPLPERYNDHGLTGNWIGFRECHIKPDLLLIYEKVGADILMLVRLGSHSELFG